MKNWHTTLLLLWLSLTPAALCIGQTSEPAAAGPAVAYVVAGSLYLATESGQVLKKIGAPVPIGDFAISPDLKKVVFASAVPGVAGGPFLILDVASGAIDPMMPDPYFNDASRAGDLAELYTDPEFSPDGRRVVFATHGYSRGSEARTSGPLAFLNIETREVSIVKSTVAGDGLPYGYMRNPHWSPDGSRILGSVEGRAFVADADGQALTEVTIPESELSQSTASYGVYAIGWLGSACILYQVGEDPKGDPARVYRLGTRTSSPAAEMLMLPEQDLRGMRGFSGRLRMFPDEAGYRVEGPGISWLIRGNAETTFVRLLPQRDGSGPIPPQCE